MEVRALTKNVRISPEKARHVSRLIQGKPVVEALAVVDLVPRKAARLIGKTLRSAVANAENNFDMNVDNLYVSTCFVDQGPTMKRIHPRSRGQAFKILKRSSHITVAVEER